MNSLIKKLSVRRVATLASLAILALALPIGLYLTQLTQDIRQQALETLPLTPPITKDYCNQNSDCGCALDVDNGQCAVQNNSFLSGVCTTPDYCSGFSGNLVPTCINNSCTLHDPSQPTPPPTATPTPTPSGAPSYLELISSPTSEVNINLAPNTGYGINAVLINTNTYEVETDLSNVYFVWGSYGNNGFFNLNASGMHADIDPVSPGKAIIYATAFDSQSQTNISTTYWMLNVSNSTTPSPTPSPSPSPSAFSPFDIDQNNRINITDYTLFITGFINGLNQ